MGNGKSYADNERVARELEARRGRTVSGRRVSGDGGEAFAAGEATCVRCGSVDEAAHMNRSEEGEICDACSVDALALERATALGGRLRGFAGAGGVAVLLGGLYVSLFSQSASSLVWSTPALGMLVLSVLLLTAGAVLGIPVVRIRSLERTGRAFGVLTLIVFGLVVVGLIAQIGAVMLAVPA